MRNRRRKLRPFRFVLRFKHFCQIVQLVKVFHFRQATGKPRNSGIVFCDMDFCVIDTVHTYPAKNLVHFFLRRVKLHPFAPGVALNILSSVADIRF